jgi:hypothetical protein
MPRVQIAFASLLAMALASAGLTRAQSANLTAESARAFLAEAYTHYSKNGKGIDQTGPRAARYFHSSLIALMQVDAKAAGRDDIPIAGDGDLICDCQDWDGIFDLKIDVQVETPQRANASVSFALFAPSGKDKGDLRKLRITLVPERGQWRIFNIVSLSQPGAPFDLRKEINKDIAFHTAGSKAKSAP